MWMMFKTFSKKLFGVRYERLGKIVPVYLIIFGGLYSSDLQIQISPFILYLMVSTFTAGVMWQVLSSEDSAEDMRNMFMMPFERKDFIFAYVSALGAYTFFIRTGALLAVVFAISPWSSLEIAGSILCACNAVVVTACIYSRGKYREVRVIWAGAFLVFLFLTYDSKTFLLMVTGNMLAAILLLSSADVYLFYDKTKRHKRTIKSSSRHSIWKYLFRYLMDHKNYLVNTVAMWGVACVLPGLFGKMEGMFVLPIGLAILSLNTPICMLLSCDPALEQAVRVLPGQRRAFCMTYCLFILLCNVTADFIYLVSWRIQVGEVRIWAILAAAFFAVQSAIASVLLEWYAPVRGWKIESDLWHHPRKYIVPVLMMLIAGIVGTMSWMIYVLDILLVAECMVLGFLVRKADGM